MFHPQRPDAAVAGYAHELGPGNDEGTFLRELGDWGDGAAATSGLEAAPLPKRIAGGTSVREDGERMLRGILSVSGGASVVDMQGV